MIFICVYTHQQSKHCTSWYVELLATKFYIFSMGNRFYGTFPNISEQKIYCKKNTKLYQLNYTRTGSSIPKDATLVDLKSVGPSLRQNGSQNCFESSEKFVLHPAYSQTRQDKIYIYKSYFPHR